MMTMRTQLFSREELIAILALDAQLRHVRIFLSRLADAKAIELVAIPADRSELAPLECPVELVRDIARDYALSERARLLAALREYGFDLSRGASVPLAGDPGA